VAAEEEKEFVKVCIDGLMLMHCIFSVQNRDRARYVEANTEKIYENSNVARWPSKSAWLLEGHLTIKSRILYLIFLQKSYPIIHNF
jgi:hypothetical protein